MTSPNAAALDGTLYQRFARIARQQPEAPAVQAADGTASYRELATRADELAARLVRPGPAPTRIGLLTGWSLEGHVAALAALCVGAAVVPLDPLASPEQLDRTVRSLGIDLLLSDGTNGERRGPDVGGSPTLRIADRSWGWPNARTDPLRADRAAGDTVAYLLSAHGGDGRTEPVVLTHSYLLAAAAAAAAAADLSPDAPLRITGARGDEGTVALIFAAWSAGATVVSVVGEPVAGTEQLLAVLWQEVLDVAEAGPGDDFFALGGHSLKAVELAFRIYDSFGVELQLHELLDAASLAGMAGLIDRQRGDVRSEAHDDLVEEIAALSDDEVRMLLDEL